MINIWIDYYPKDEKVFVFINGHALCRESSTFSVAHKLAEAAGLEEVSIKVYGEGQPKTGKMNISL